MCYFVFGFIISFNSLILLYFFAFVYCAIFHIIIFTIYVISSILSDVYFGWF